MPQLKTRKTATEAVGSITDVVDDWIADRRLSRRKKEFLEAVYTAFQDSGGLYSPDVAGGFYCEELNLPQGGFKIQVVAALLDHLDPLPEPPTRLVEVTEQLVEDGHIEREEAEKLYEMQ
jgi:hypothetical protein